MQAKVRGRWLPVPIYDFETAGVTGGVALVIVSLTGVLRWWDTVVRSSLPLDPWAPNRQGEAAEPPHNIMLHRRKHSNAKYIYIYIACTFKNIKYIYIYITFFLRYIKEKRKNFMVIWLNDFSLLISVVHFPSPPWIKLQYDQSLLAIVSSI